MLPSTPSVTQVDNLQLCDVICECSLFSVREDAFVRSKIVEISFWCKPWHTTHLNC